jgi:hypothetical protein
VVERGLGSSLPPAELARRDLGVFVEMKCLFSIVSKDEKGGEVVKCFYAEKRATNAALGSIRRWPSVYRLTLTRAATADEHQTHKRSGVGRMTSASCDRFVRTVRPLQR